MSVGGRTHLIISSRTPEGVPNLCPVCGADFKLEPSNPPGDAPCPYCGHLVWFEGSPGSVTVVRFGGNELMERASVEAVARQLDASVLAASRRGIVLDFTEIQFLDGTALGQLITLQKRLDAEQTRLCLCGLERTVMEVFNATRLAQLFEFYPTVEAALRSF